MKTIILSNGEEAVSVRDLFEQWSVDRKLTFSDGERKLSLGEAIQILGGETKADCAGIFELYDELGLYVGQVWGI